MSAYVLSNLLHKLGKRDKMPSLPNILSLFCNEWHGVNIASHNIGISSIFKYFEKYMNSLDPNRSRMECDASICGNKQHIKEKKTIYFNVKIRTSFKMFV